MNYIPPQSSCFFFLCLCLSLFFHSILSTPSKVIRPHRHFNIFNVCKNNLILYFFSLFVFFLFPHLIFASKGNGAIKCVFFFRRSNLFFSFLKVFFCLKSFCFYTIFTVSNMSARLIHLFSVSLFCLQYFFVLACLDFRV